MLIAVTNSHRHYPRYAVIAR